MVDAYSIYQQALDLESSSFGSYSSVTIGVGVAKLMQILLPQIVYYLTAFILRSDSLTRLVMRFMPGQDQAVIQGKVDGWIEEFQRLQGFFVWKLACDLGFFLIVTEYGSWLRAVTLSGLIVYTFVQYIVYYQIGQRLILNPLLRQQSQGRPRPIRTTKWKRLASKLFYEELGVTISQVRPSAIIAKILVDYVSMWASWSAYTVGFFLFANGGLNFSAFNFFPHVSMISLYLSVYLGYASLFTTLELVLRGLAMHRRTPIWARKLFLSKSINQFLAVFAVALVLPLLINAFVVGWKAFGWNTARWNRVERQWVNSQLGHVPRWQPNRSMTSACDARCLEDQFLAGPYTTIDQ